MTLALPSASDKSKPNRHNPSSRGKGGRPPRTESAIINVLSIHPELQGKSVEIARFLARADPTFAGITGDAVSAAFSKLRRKYGDGLDPRSFHADAYHIGRVVRAEQGEKVCESCGATLGYDNENAAGRSTNRQNSFDNRLWRVFNTRGIAWSGRGSMISQAAVAISEFGDDVRGKLTRKALVGLEELCKSFTREELPQEITTQLARLVEAECETRAKNTKRAELDEAKDAVISACLSGMEKWPQYSLTFSKCIKLATSYFPDLMGAKSKPSKLTKLDPIEEEERNARVMESEERSGRSSETESNFVGGRDK